METLATLVSTLNSLSPLGVIALLAVIIYLQVKGKQQVSGQVDTLATNHLHEVTESLQRIELLLVKEFSYIRTKLGNGNG